MWRWFNSLVVLFRERMPVRRGLIPRPMRSMLNELSGDLLGIEQREWGGTGWEKSVYELIGNLKV